MYQIRKSNNENFSLKPDSYKNVMFMITIGLKHKSVYCLFGK